MNNTHIVATWCNEVATGVFVIISLGDCHDVANSGQDMGFDLLPTILSWSGHDMAIRGHNMGECEIDLNC